MADNTGTTLAALMYELHGAMSELFGSDHPFSSELSGIGDPQRVGRYTRAMDTNRDIYSGSNIRFPLIPYGMQSGGFASATSTWNVPSALTTAQATATLSRVIVPFTITVDAERDTMGNSEIEAVTLLVDQAHKALAKLEEIAFLGDGTGLIATITDAATSLTTTVATTSNWDILLPGNIFDVLTVATGADPGQGLRRQIASVVESTGVITWATAATASDGGSGSIVHTSADGIYLAGSYGNVSQGLAQAAAVTGTFEGIAKASFPYWQGTDGRNGTTTTLALSNSMLDAGTRRGRRWGIGVWDYGIGDPAAIDLWKQGLYAQLRYDPAVSTLKGGFQGAVYEGADKPFPLIKAPFHAKGQLELVRNDFMQLYGDKKGPAFLDDDGAMWRRFSRALPKEADLLDRVQLAFKSVNGIVFFKNLDVAV